MKVEIEIPDLASYYVGYNDEEVTIDDIKKYFIKDAIDSFVDGIYDKDFDYRQAIDEGINKIIKEHKQDIINNITERVTETIIKNKAIVEQMPKKSEINNISKEWENYFVELIDKAIAKRFK